MIPFKFNFKDLIALDFDFEASKKSIPLIAQKVLNEQLRGLRTELRGFIPRKTGKLQRAFGFSVRRTQGKVTARFGFLTNKRVSASTAIAANVLQAGGASPRKGKYLWIPLPGIQTTPRQLIAGGGFITTSKAGSRIAFQRGGVPSFVLRTHVRLSRPPVPIEGRVEKQIPAIVSDVEETIKQVIEAKKKVESVI